MLAASRWWRRLFSAFVRKLTWSLRVWVRVSSWRRSGVRLEEILIEIVYVKDV
jgi:hypothetical protein